MFSFFTFADRVAEHRFCLAMIVPWSDWSGWRFLAERKIRSILAASTAFSHR